MTELDSEEQFDAALAQHAQRLIVLEASLTWCRPCKGFERTYQVRAAVESVSALLGSNPAHGRGPGRVHSQHVRSELCRPCRGLQPNVPGACGTSEGVCAAFASTLQEVALSDSIAL